MSSPMMDQAVLSTHVEVVRNWRRQLPRVTRALHARGGGPFAVDGLDEAAACSPRTWRWSVHVAAGDEHAAVLSTHVEVVRRLDQE